MSVSAADVRRVAALARLALSEERVEGLVAELNGILAHMDVLGAAARAAEPEAPDAAVAAPSPLRPDVGPPLPLDRTPSEFAPDFRDGFFAVPRLASHAAGEPEA